MAPDFIGAAMHGGAVLAGAAVTDGAAGIRRDGHTAGTAPDRVAPRAVDGIMAVDARLMSAAAAPEDGHTAAAVTMAVAVITAVAVVTTAADRQL